MIKGEKRRPKSSSFNSKVCGCDCVSLPVCTLLLPQEFLGFSMHRSTEYT